MSTAFGPSTNCSPWLGSDSRSWRRTRTAQAVHAHSASKAGPCSDCRRRRHPLDRARPVGESEAVPISVRAGPTSCGWLAAAAAWLGRPVVQGGGGAWGRGHACAARAGLWVHVKVGCVGVLGSQRPKVRAEGGHAVGVFERLAPAPRPVLPVVNIPFASRGERASRSRPPARAADRAGHRHWEGRRADVGRRRVHKAPSRPRRERAGEGWRARGRGR